MTSATPTVASEASDSERDAIRREIQLEIERQVLAALAPSAITTAPTAPAGVASGSAGNEARTRGPNAHASQTAVWNKHRYASYEQRILNVLSSFCRPVLLTVLVSI